MDIVVRTYTGKGAIELFDTLEKRAADVEHVMRSVKGFISYTLARSSDGGFSVTVCKDKAGIDEANQKAKEWVAINAAEAGAASPKLTLGTTTIHIRSSAPEYASFQELQAAPSRHLTSSLIA